MSEKTDLVGFFTAHWRGEAKMDNLQEQISAVRAQVARAVSGKQDVTDLMLMAMLAGGHVLLEDVPGVGKTTTALAFSRALGLDFKRVQFTPDVVPSDVTGFTMYEQGSAIA